MSKLPLELLKEKYIPIVEFPEKYGISVIKIKSLIDAKKIRYAEFRVPGEHKRSIHVNYEEVLAVLAKEKTDESDNGV